MATSGRAAGRGEATGRRREEEAEEAEEEEDEVDEEADRGSSPLLAPAQVHCHTHRPLAGHEREPRKVRRTFRKV